MKTLPAARGIMSENSKSAGFIRIIVTFATFFLSAISGIAQQADSVPNIKIWAAPCEQKIRSTDSVENNNLVWSGKKRQISVAGAGNEHVPFQVVITTPVPSEKKSSAANGFFMKVSDLKSASGKMIPQSRVYLYFEHYIQIFAVSGPIGATGYWPDALAPLKVPFGMSAQYTSVGNRPVWVDVYIPAGTPAGIYKGTITITLGEKIISTPDLNVEVYNFSLPEETHLITYFNISRSDVARASNLQASSTEAETLFMNYFTFLFDHRMETWRNELLVPQVIINGDNVEVKFNDAHYDYFMNKLKTKRVVLLAIPRGLGRGPGLEQFSPAFNKIVKSYLTQAEAYFKKHGWIDHLVINSPIDEPRSKEDFENTRRWAQLVHESIPGIPFLATKSPVSENPDWGTLRGYVNNFCVHGNALNDPEVKQAIKEEQLKGGEATWYISCGQRYPQPNYFIDAPAMDPLMVPWITARYHMNGILYWATNYWSETTDPWVNPVTFLSGFNCGYDGKGYVLNGEGSLMYPGDHTRRFTSQPNVQGPVSSIRFELLREGIEDYEYIWMLKNEGDSDFAEKQVANMVIDVSTFSRNVEELYIARKAMARRLEELTNKPVRK